MREMDQVQERESKPATSKPSRSGAQRRQRNKPLYFWSSSDVRRYLRKHQPSLHTSYGDLLQQHAIAGRTIASISEWKLEKIGITNKEDRETLMSVFMELRLRRETEDLRALQDKGFYDPR